MRARDLAQPFPYATLDADAYEAAVQMARERRPGLIVVDEREQPVAILPGTQVLNFLIPHYVQEDPRLARVYDDAAADELSAKLRGRTVREVLPERELREVEIVDADATTLEIAAVMAREHSPVVAVVDDSGMIGAITLSHLLAALLPPR